MDVEAIAKGFGVPLLATLPSSGMARLTMMNSGESLFTAAPRDPYTQAVRKIAQALHREYHGDVRTTPSLGGGNWLHSITSRLGMN